MEQILKEFLMYNLIENIFIVLMYGVFTNKKPTIIQLLILTISFSMLNIFIKIFVPVVIVMQIIGISIMSLTFSFVYKDKFLYSAKYVFIIMFGIMLLFEMAVHLVYFFMNIDLSTITDFNVRFMYYIPVYILDYIALIFVCKKNKLKKERS